MKLKYMLLALMPLCMASCSEEETIAPVEMQREVRVTAGADAQSRVVLSDQGNRVRSLWQNGDKISLFTSTQKDLVYSTDIEENVATAIFTPEGESLVNAEGDSVYACYPAVTLASGGDMVVNLPSTTTMDYADGTIRSFGYAVGTIADDNVNLKFEHISAFLGLTLTPDSLTDATKAISSVKVITSSDVPLSVGDGDTFDFSTRKATTTNGNNTVEITVDNWTVEDSWTVYIPLLPQPGGVNITVTLADSEGTVLYTRTKPTPAEGFLAGRVYMQGVYDKAYLIDGPTFNERIRQLASSDNNYYGHNYNIGKIRFVTGVTEVPENYKIVSADDSSAPIYASFSETDSLLTISTKARDIEVVNASEMFHELSGLRKVEFGDFDVNETTTNTSYMFDDCNELTILDDVSNWNTKNVTNMERMFGYCWALNNLDVSLWNTINVENMSEVFYHCESLESLDVDDWKTGNVRYMGGLFDGCYKLTELNVSQWDTQNVERAYAIFAGCSALTELNIADWDTKSMVDIGRMFEECSSVKELNVSKWNTDKVEYMYGVFSGCSSLAKLDLSGWNTENVTDMGRMFSLCSSIKELDLSMFNTSKVQGMGSMFSGCSALASLTIPENWVTSSVEHMEAMFSGCSSLTELELSGWNTENVTDMGSMFENCSSIKELDLSMFNTSKVRGMSYMFDGCSALTSLTISENWVTSNVEHMDAMFSNCSSLETVNVKDWDVSKVTDMRAMFEGCEKLMEVEVANWNTESVRNMGQMFRCCSALTELEISEWNVSSVEDMTSMFEDCSALSELNVSNWITTSLRNPGAMFKGCSKLEEINVSNWNTDEVDNISEMFSGCSSLTSLEVSTWNTENVTGMNRVFENCSSLSTLDLSNWTVDNIYHMNGIFANCTHLTQLNISNWSLNEEDYEEDYYGINNMFENCASDSQACRITATQETRDFLESKLAETDMTKEWFTWETPSNE